MSGKETILTSASVATTNPQQMAENEEDTSWTQHLPPIEESAPGDKLHDTLEDFVLNQSEGEESSDSSNAQAADGKDPASERDPGDDDAAGDDGGGQTGNGDGANKENEGESEDKVGEPVDPGASTKRKRYSANHRLVLCLLHTTFGYRNEPLAKVFNHVFHHEGSDRSAYALKQRWRQWKTDWDTKLANLTTAQRAENVAWERKIRDAVWELSLGENVES